MRRALAEVKLGAVAGRGAMFWIAMLAILAAAMALRLPRMTHSFWGDEDWAHLDYHQGKYEVKADGSLKFERAPWKQTLWRDRLYQQPPIRFSVLARESLDLWQRATGATEHAFSESPVRLAPLAAGIGSLIAGALLLHRLGYPWAALLWALFMAFHPWHVRYSVEGRGYSMLAFFLLLAAWFGIRALETGRWRHWLGFGAMQFFAMWTWKAAVHPLVWMNLALAAGAWITRPLWADRAAQWKRQVFTGLLWALPFLPLILPTLPQIQHYLANSTMMKRPMGAEWLAHEWVGIASGLQWQEHEPGSPFHTAQEIPLPLLVLVDAGIAAALIAGLISLVRRRKSAAALVLALPILGGLTLYAHFLLSGLIVLHWYVFFAVPFAFALAAAGLEAVCSAARRSRRVMAMPLAAAVAIAFLWNALPQDRALMQLPSEGLREAAELTRGQHEARDYLGPSKVRTVALWRGSPLYDPRVDFHVRDAEALKAAMRAAAADQAPLGVIVGNIGFAEANDQDFLKLVRDRRYFHPLKTLYGTERDYTLYVFQFTGRLPE
ncbi:MAG: glycosyltransferase family 39 protein [Verrucomicrobiales bacterium]